MADIGIPSLQQFLTHVRQYNLARQERFFVEFADPTNGITMSLLCHQASLPGKTINTRTLRVNGLDRAFAQSADYMGGQGITLEFLIDGFYTPRVAIENWMEKCVSTYEDTTASLEVGFYDEYAQNITLYTTAPTEIEGTPEAIGYSITLVDAWPRTMNVVPLGWDTPGVQRMSVEFIYHHWEADRQYITDTGTNTANSSSRNAANPTQPTRRTDDEEDTE